MPKRTDIHKILVIGSGPIVIGQAAEFDYAGSQACQSLREEGYEVILINSNPATIMTDTTIADRVYIEPINLDFAKRVIYKERPDAILGSLGGQTGLNLVVELHEDGILDEYGVEILGTDLLAINRAEDRELFRELMQQIGEPVPHSRIVHTVEEAVEEAEYVLDALEGDSITYPVVFDLEQVAHDEARTDDLSVETATEITQAFCQTIDQAGYQPMIYGNVTWLMDRIDLTQLTEYQLWLAQYQSTPTFPYQFTMWQYSHQGSVAGIEGNVDLNLLLTTLS